MTIFRGMPTADILVVCDPATQTRHDRCEPMTMTALSDLLNALSQFDISREDLAFVTAAPPIPLDRVDSVSKTSKWLAEHRPEFLSVCRRFNPKMILVLGSLALRQVSGRALPITKARGVALRHPDFPVPALAMFSPAYVRRLPQHKPLFDTDIGMVGALKDAGWDASSLNHIADVEYSWATDLTFLKDKIDAGDVSVMSVDTETKALLWHKPEFRLLTVQLCWEPGKAIAVPVSRRYMDTGVSHMAMLDDLRGILQDERIRYVAHNCKFDYHAMRVGLDVEVDFWMDTQMLAFSVDENMMSKSLADCVRRWVPDLAGYSDAFDASIDKSDMTKVDPDEMLPYACGDADATYRLAKRLVPLARDDAGQWNVLRNVQMPALKAFADTVEPAGMYVDVDALSALQQELDVREKADHAEIIGMIPRAVRQRHAEKGLKLSRDGLVRDALFSREGLGIKPLLYTKSTQNLPAAERVPSASSKTHLPFFDDDPLVAKIIAYRKLDKIRSTYVGHPMTNSSPATGFWQYLSQGNRVFPSFMLHRTVTGRSASANPNAQNFPKRGPLAEAFRRCFVAPPGYVLVESDLSQAELRIAAWMAMEDTMLAVYRRGGDIHAETAAATMGITQAEFHALPSDVKKLQRFRAKAVNFGFLYGMWWKKFRAYARTDYGIVLTDAEAQSMRTSFFEKYPKIEDWHVSMGHFVETHGFVRALHGAVRHLPDVWSNDENIAKGAKRQAINSPVQRFASDLGLIAMARLTRDADPEKIRPVAFIHDSLVTLVREDDVDESMGAIKFYMESPPLERWFNAMPPLPITADVAMGHNLAEMNEMDVPAVTPHWYRPEMDLHPV